MGEGGEVHVVKSDALRATAGEVALRVLAVDYLKLLEGGNFIHFVALVKADNDVAQVDIYNLRLKVIFDPTA